MKEAPKGPGTAFTFLYYFSGTSLVGALLASQVLHVGFSTGIPSQFGGLMGLIGGLMGTYFNRSRTLELPVKSKKELLNRLNPILTHMGYTLAEDMGDGLVYQRSGLRALLSGSIYITLDQKMARLTSRAIHLRTIQKQLM